VVPYLHNNAGKFWIGDSVSGAQMLGVSASAEESDPTLSAFGVALGSASAGTSVLVSLSSMINMPVPITPMAHYYAHANGTLMTSAAGAISSLPYAWGLPQNRLRLYERGAAQASTTTQISENTTLVHTPVCVPAQCRAGNHTTSTAKWASAMSSSCPSDSSHCDDCVGGADMYSSLNATNASSAWYRFTGGAELPVVSPGQFHDLCYGSAWLKAPPPPTSNNSNWYQSFNSTVCFDYTGSNCTWSTTVQTTDCRGFHVYEVEPVPFNVSTLPCGSNGWRGPTGACWYYATDGHSCTAACMAAGSSCIGSGHWPTSYSEVSAISQGLYTTGKASTYCGYNRGSSTYPYSYPYSGSQHYCYHASSSTSDTCASTTSGGYSRFCPCGS